MIEYFTDPILRAPAWGCMLMCLSASLMGAIVFLRKESLVAEALSHASYPGVILALFAVACFFPQQGSQWALLAVLAGAFGASFLGLRSIEWLQRKRGVPADAALCFILSVFFGTGIALASGLQSSYPSWYKQVQMLLFGQAATMTDMHALLYGSLAAGIILFFTLFYRPLQAILFDRAYAKSLGIRAQGIERLFFLFLLLSVIVGMRSVGVILVSGMLIAPASAARQYTNRLSTMLLLSGFFGLASAFLGYLISVEGSLYWSTPEARCSLPTGPLIVLTGVVWTFVSLCLAPKRGVLFRFIRMGAFRLRCLQENILKHLWRHKEASRQQMAQYRLATPLLLRWILWRMVRQGWLQKVAGRYELTGDGYRQAASVVRLHRLWEVYLIHYLDKGPEYVHRNAEEMEHILTPELEEKLTRLLADPQRDPHHQPIPGRQRL